MTSTKIFILRLNDYESLCAISLFLSLDVPLIVRGE